MKDIVSVRIKDGLFIGDRKTGKNLQFLVANKFTHIINCTSELKNHFEQYKQLRYLKLRYDKSNPRQRLWGESMKKLFRVIEFINACQQKGECCLVYSNTGTNRSFAIITAYLMNKYSWTLPKTLEYVKSKKREYQISDNYIIQLQQLEQQLKSYRILTSSWSEIGYENQEELILVNTFLNTIKNQDWEMNHPPLRKKSVKWKDVVDKKDHSKLQEISKTVVFKETQAPKVKRREEGRMKKPSKSKSNKNLQQQSHEVKEKPKMDVLEVPGGPKQLQVLDSLQEQIASNRSENDGGYQIILNNWINPKAAKIENPSRSPIENKNKSVSLKRLKEMNKTGRLSEKSKSRVDISESLVQSLSNFHDKACYRKLPLKSINGNRQKSNKELGYASSIRSIILNN